ncbi:MAG TPA: VOC family protein [Candidatus Magasanikbacteria bacterium]|nr:VOC family protein [Candidatus Magasanikbacteria bacterium]
MGKQKITPHLWFDTEARAAAEFYAATFPNSKVNSVRTIHNTPSGDCDIVSFDVMGYEFMSISAGPLFKINPSISFMINFDPSDNADARIQIDTIWEKLVEGGKVLMPLEKYPFSERYGWVEDKYSVSWQLIFTDPKGEKRPTVIPSLLFVGDKNGKAEEATNFYLSVFKDSKRGTIARYGAGQEPNRENDVMFTDFTLEGQWFVAMDSAYEHKFAFNEAVSFIVHCDTQEEIDYYWEKLSAVPQSEQCGWLKDMYGVSWQITPTAMDTMMQHGSPEQIARVTEAFLKMKKFDISTLEKAYKGE